MVVIIILIATALSIVNGVNIFGTTNNSKDNDQVSFDKSPNSTSNNLHIILTGSVVGIVILIVAIVILRVLASRDTSSSNALEVERELTNRARLDPNPPQMPWYPSAPAVPHQSPHQLVHQAAPYHPHPHVHPIPHDFTPRYRYLPAERN